MKERDAAPKTTALKERALTAAGEWLLGLPERDRDIFLVRLSRYWRDLVEGLRPPYGGREDFEAFVIGLVESLTESYVARPEDLKKLDLRRMLEPGWFQDERTVGYVLYTDLFSGDLKSLPERLPYLRELGVTYLHLMPLLATRKGENDGGYAVSDYRKVEPRLGTLDDLREVCRSLREAGISLCLDLVLNHTAREHEWAAKARAGEQEYQEMYLTFPDRKLPDAYEATLPEVFPETSPGSFTYDAEMGRWVWTTFESYQWDLDWSNPKVFCEMAGVLLYLANTGVEVFRLDAVAFLWKRLGTDCQNQPEAHDLLQALRACSRIVCPAVVHKAEAIVSPDDLVHYLGTGERHGRESDLAYHNSLMVHYWSSLASRDVRLASRALARFPEKPSGTAWATYLRGHDDIGWAITDEDAAAVGLSGFAHRAFLSDYYSGSFPGSHARGAVYQENPLTGDRRISGTLASLAGVEAALEANDERLLDLAVGRILLGYALMFGYGGVPLMYMGDEISLTNDRSYLKDPRKARDNRWMHRPPMDWKKAGRRSDPRGVEGRVFRGVVELVAARKRTPHLNAAAPTHVLETGHPHVLTYIRSHPLGTLVGLHNFTEDTQYMNAGLLRHQGMEEFYDRISASPLRPDWKDDLVLSPYGSLWVTAPPKPDPHIH
ncbi:Alpha amylase, catalytic domain [Rubrobacter radiotolerans]|uniref:Alpha amylase, catalytic domain n=1 Tax=Rubrobacter radiotolerans TaxID=42256 RepID=A0A023X2S5_RUBRA|nr:Alpha amylase, catalytic domain [Rubrobacter radiotolerans]SMC04480.1 amylosucrase [Rubrobacter radiotolerans DSM 5868]